MVDGWKKTKLGNIFIVENYKIKQINSLKYQEIGNIPIIDQSSQFICGYTDDEAKRISLSEPVVIFGDHTRHVKYINFDFALGADGTQVLKSKNKSVLKFLYYLICRASELIGSYGYDRHLKHLRDISIEFPENPNEQSKIAEILTKIDEAIDQTENIIAKQERIKEGLIQDLFTKGIDEYGNIRSEETHKFKDSLFDRIPEEWEVKTLLAALNNNSYLIVAGPFGSNLKVSDYKEAGIPIIRLQNIERNEFVFKNMKYISEEKAKSLNYHNFVTGDIVLAKLGDPIGKTCIIPDILKHGIVVADVVRIRPTKDMNKEFLVRILNSKFVEYQLTHDIIGTTRPRVNLNQVRNLLLFLPSKDEQDRLADKLSKLDYYVDSEKQKLSKLKRIKAGLMQDLLTGKVRVTHLLEQEAAV